MIYQQDGRRWTGAKSHFGFIIRGRGFQLALRYTVRLDV